MTKVLLFLALMALTAGCVYAITLLQPASEQIIHQTVFEAESFFQGVEQAKIITITPDYRIAGGVVPHHLLPSHIIADFFSRLSYQKPKTIIIIGPNHTETGNFQVITGTGRWQTPFGITNANEQIVSELVSKNFAQVDETVVAADHAVSGLIPFISYYLPDTTVVPLLISRSMDQAELLRLAIKLGLFLDQDTILVASVDFSHYLTSVAAQQKDSQTLKAITNFDYRTILTFTDDHVDSPGSLVVLLESMKRLGKTEREILHHTNSGILQKNSTAQTTSYFSIAYY